MCPHVQFTMEGEQNSSIFFLDVLATQKYLKNDTTSITLSGLLASTKNIYSTFRLNEFPARLLISFLTKLKPMQHSSLILLLYLLLQAFQTKLDEF